MAHLKIKSADEMRRIVEQLKAENKTVALANGCFDIIHGGHVSYLRGAAETGDTLIVALNSDVSVRGLKGEGRPILPEVERAEILAAFEMVDYVVLFDEPSVDALLEKLLPDVHAKGTDYTSDSVPERATNDRLGIRTAIVGAPKQNATRGIISRIQNEK
ncbi:adenylyltransferase/cytidyltransferase family protein [Candidatus Sumerlaeota bacterium]|nr:adenylyltransferase/cytidyltransferase family protein [Candidatus Sumerlaeota bacterium]